MIISSSEVDPARYNPKVCIIGAGAAGITLACEFDGCGFDVLMLEAGNEQEMDARSRDVYAGTAIEPHADPLQFRRMGWGGTTRIWGGRCVPLDPIDFDRREHISSSGWPIAYDEVARFYPAALAYCHAGAFDFSVDGALAGAIPMMPGLDRAADVVSERIERYSLPTDFGRAYRKRIAASTNVTAMLDARASRLRKRVGEDIIESVEIIDRRGRAHRIRADFFIVACGGIETTRILFASDPEGPGLGNRGDQLGRYYACHLENVCARLFAPAGAPIAFAFERSSDGIYCRRKLQLTPNAQREHRLPNMAFRLHFPDYADASHRSAVMSAIYLAKSSLIPEYQVILQHGLEHGEPDRRAHWRNVVSGMPRLGRFALTMLFRRVLAKRKLPYTLIANADGSYPLEFNAEQTPLASSRIRPSDRFDADGVRRIHVDWRVDPADFDACLRAFHVLRSAIARTSSARIEFDEASIATQIRASIPVGGHHMGSARMATNDRQGVVDRNGAVFGLPNLYLASAATFPTNGHANPTLTIVAMAIRLATHLKERF